MKLSMIVATANKNVIGLNNQMPWHLPADFAWFKQTTMGKPIIMGRKTYDSIGKPLPGRLNIVLTRDSSLRIEGCLVASSLKEALLLAEKENASDDDADNEIFIIGGAHLYHEYLGDIDTLYLTIVDAELEGDTFFPDYTQYDWNETHRSEYSVDEKNAYSLTWLKLERIRVPSDKA